MDVLVHISAPTSKKDDDHYRAQALAYLNFELAVSHGCERVEQEAEESELTSEPLVQEFGVHGEDPHENAYQQSPRAGMTAQRRSALSSSASFQPTAHVASHVNQVLSTPLQKLEDIQTVWKSRQNSSSTPRKRPCVDLTDTQLLFSTQYAIAALETQVYSYSSGSGSLTALSPLRQQETKRRRISRHSQSPVPSVSSGCSIHTSALDIFQRATRVVESASPDQTPDRPDLLSSQLPDTYELSKSDESSVLHTPIPKEHSQDTLKSPGRTSADPSPNSGANGSAATVRSKSFQIYRSAVHSISQSTTRTWSSQPSPTNIEKENIRPATAPNSTKHSPVHQTPGRLPISTQNPLQESTTIVSQLPPPHLLLELRSLPKQILPPTPVTSNTRASEATFITDVLKSLANQEELWKRYHLHHHQSRAISKFERGYWRLDTRNWPIHHQIKFWRKLMQFVGNGRIGLATSCFRLLDDAADGQEKNLGTVKVYCWGEIVMHVWLFLYTMIRSEMSRSESGHQSATWVDVDGIVVVRMP
jgi:hypothetical protein